MSLTHWGIDMKYFDIFFIPYWTIMTGWWWGLTIWLHLSVSADWMPLWFIGLFDAVALGMIAVLYTMIKAVRT